MISKVVSIKNKTTRLQRIQSLIGAGNIKSQVELIKILKQEGFNVTQATISRDLQELKVVKVRNSDGTMRYSIASSEIPKVQNLDGLKRILSEWVIEIGSSYNIVVVKTAPGSAHVVGSALDRANLKEVLGTVAGDDTLMIIVKEQFNASTVASFLLSLIRQ